MSLGDGLANALKRYVRAKERHGLKAILLGEVDPSVMESDPTAAKPANGNGNGHGKHEVTDVTLAAARLGESISPRNSYAVKCPECGGDLDMGEGCVKCHGCGFSQC